MSGANSSEDPYLASLDTLSAYLGAPALSDVMAEVVAVEREFPLLAAAEVSSCSLRHGLSNNLGKEWVRKLVLGVRTPLDSAEIHRQFRDMADDGFVVSFASDDETSICTQYSLEVLNVSTVSHAEGRPFYITAERSGYSKVDAMGFLPKPFLDWTLPPGASPLSVSIDVGTRRGVSQTWAVADAADAARQTAKDSVSTRWSADTSILTDGERSIVGLLHIGCGDQVALGWTTGATGYAELLAHSVR